MNRPTFRIRRIQETDKEEIITRIYKNWFKIRDILLRINAHCDISIHGVRILLSRNNAPHFVADYMILRFPDDRQDGNLYLDQDLINQFAHLRLDNSLGPTLFLEAKPKTFHEIALIIELQEEKQND